MSFLQSGCTGWFGDTEMVIWKDFDGGCYSLIELLFQYFL
jgi:hypothetical protein